MVKKHLKNTIIIGGAGISGLITSYILANQDFNVILIDKNDLSKSPQNEHKSTAISFESQKLLRNWDIWNSLEIHCGEINEIRVTNNHHPLFIHFDGKKNFDHPLGFMVLNIDMINNLLNLVKNHKNISIFDKQEITNINYINNHIEVETTECKFLGNLLISADGKFSNIRKISNISNFSYDYKQTAIVFNIHHSITHNQIAHEVFMKNGPLALLPLKDPNMSSIVWIEKNSIANKYLSLDIQEFQYFLQNKLKNILGEIKNITKVASYPLSVMMAEKYVTKKIALIADAAHSMHPISGQGLNQGIKDIESLTNKLIAYKSLGLDIASNTLLEEYQASRLGDNLAMYFITDSFNKLFSNNNKFINFLRIGGIGLVNKSDFLKKFFMKYAMGERFKN